MAYAEFVEAYGAVQRNRKMPGQNGQAPCVDDAALESAKRTVDALDAALPLALSRAHWTQLTAIIQGEIAVAIRLAAYERASLPSVSIAGSGSK